VKRRGPFSPDSHWHQTQVQLILGGMLVLVVVGGGLIWLLYGWTAAITAVSCLLVVAGLIGLLWLVLRLLEAWVGGDEP
jgi:hypothetical protein